MRFTYYGLAEPPIHKDVSTASAVRQTRSRAWGRGFLARQL